MAEKVPKWPKLSWKSEKWYPKPSPLDFCVFCSIFEWSHEQFTTILCLRPRLAKSGQKWPKRAPNDRNWPECLKNDIRNHLHWISASLAVILSGHMTSLHQLWVWGQICQKMALQMTKNGLKIWKVTSETISIGFLLLLRSFWVVTWLACDNFEFGAKIGKNGQKWPKKAPNDRKWPECL